MKKPVLATFLISLLLVGGAFAAPTAQIIGGLTTVELSPEAVQAFNSLNISLSAIPPGRFNPQNSRFSFPIPGGAIDLGTLSGDIFHTGGIALDSSDTNVSLLNFIISTTGQPPVLTGLVAVNDDIVDRIPLYNLELTQPPQEGEYGTIIIPDVNLTLTQTAADVLNDTFGTTAFEANLLIGSAVVVAQRLEPNGMQDDSGNVNQTE
jgi:hypothetical protein